MKIKHGWFGGSGSIVVRRAVAANHQGRIYVRLADERDASAVYVTLPEARRIAASLARCIEQIEQKRAGGQP